MERPILRPGAVLLHRPGRPGSSSIQLGLDAEWAVRLDVPSASCDAVLAGLDGTRTADEVLAAAVARGADPAVAALLLERLRTAGLLVDARTWLAWARDWDGTERGRRLPDLHAWDRYADVADVVERRRTSAVRILGAGRVGAAVALLLGAAGVGRLEVLDTAVVTAADLTPYGYRAEQLGRSRGQALRELLTSPSVTVAGVARHADAVVLCPDTREPDRDTIAALDRAGLPHLLVRCRDLGGTAGPFVLPGRTACIRCTDLHRTDRDPDWPVLLSQLTGVTGAVPDTVLAAQLAAFAAAQVLHWLAGELPATAGSTVDIQLAGGLGRSRDWPPHPYCGCHWPEQFRTDAG
ncbi:MAG TPA: ThiF family adenylyltransferase [Kribbellaceae bacterium]|nr:ThiF family adenylyltransferase [Kribbellaceae bacterium]